MIKPTIRVILAFTDLQLDIEETVELAIGLGKLELMEQLDL